MECSTKENAHYWYFNMDEPHMKDLMWYNLVYMKIEFAIQGFVFRDEFLYDRKRSSYMEIKRFAIELIKEQVLEEGGGGYKTGISSFTFENLEHAAEYVVSRIKREIYFYNKFAPFKLLSYGMFGNGMGIDKEFLIPITVDVDVNENESYHDEMMWDILNEKNM